MGVSVWGRVNGNGEKNLGTKMEGYEAWAHNLLFDALRHLQCHDGMVNADVRRAGVESKL